MNYIYNAKHQGIYLENEAVCYVFSSIVEACKYLQISKDTLNLYRKNNITIKGFLIKNIQSYFSVKKCHTCKVLLTTDNRVLGKAGGTASICKTCKKHYYEKNKNVILQKYKEDYTLNKEKYSKKSARYYLNNRERVLLKAKKYREKMPRNKAMRAKHETKRRFLKINSKKAFVGFDKEIELIYKQALNLTETTGITHHVDHIIPLINKKVCGLHVPWNLQIITAEENLKKSNKFQGGLP